MSLSIFFFLSCFLSYSQFSPRTVCYSSILRCSCLLRLHLNTFRLQFFFCRKIFYNFFVYFWKRLIFVVFSISFAAQFIQFSFICNCCCLFVVTIEQHTHGFHKTKQQRWSKIFPNKQQANNTENIYIIKYERERENHENYIYRL